MTKLKKSKAYYAFEQKLIYFDDDIDLIDVVRLSILKGDLNDNDSVGPTLKNLDRQKHSHLSRRSFTDGTRKLIANHLRQTIYSSYVKEIYEEVTFYLRSILEKSAENHFDSGRIIGEHSFRIDAKTVLEAGSWEEVSKIITSSVFQALEAEKSTLKLFEKISNKLALDIDKALITKAIPYLEVRHYLVHNNGVVPTDFNNGSIKLSVDKKGAMTLDFRFISSFRSTIKELITAFDEAVVSKELLSDKDLHGG